jgi:hypothetical protein
MMVNCPAWVMLIMPAQAHMHMEVLLSAGMPPIITCGEPGTQGDAVTGTHGMGVNTPSLAAVAAATVGLVMVLHMPKGMMFTMGLWSMMVAVGMPEHRGLSGVGSTVRLLGIVPKEHVSIAPETTIRPTGSPPGL